MLIHSFIYKRHFPFQSSTEIQQLEEKEREKLIKCIRQFPITIRAWRVSAKLSAAKYHHGPASYLEFNATAEEIHHRFEELATKVSKRYGLTREELLDVNVSLCAKKYNWFWSIYFRPTKDIEQLIRNNKMQDLRKTKELNDGRP